MSHSIVVSVFTRIYCIWTLKNLIFGKKLYTWCNRRNVRDFGRVFLRSNYTDITQNTYIQSSMVTEILAREMFRLLWFLRTVLCSWRHTRRIPTLSLDAAHSDLGDVPYVSRVYSGWKSVDNYDTCASVFVVQFNGLCHSQVTFMLCRDINITETTYYCQFQYVFGNQ